jgi:hypothetical protein
MATTKRSIVDDCNKPFNCEDYQRFLKLQKKGNNNATVLYAANWLVKNAEYRGEIFHTELLFLQKMIERMGSKPITTAKGKRIVSLFSMFVVDPFLDRFSSQMKIRSRLKVALKLAHRGVKGKKMRGSIIKNLSYTMDQLIKHLENQFQEGMTWKNYGGYAHCWNVDHIYPRSRLLYDSVKHPNFQKCWSLNNLQPMWVKDNLKKGNLIPKNFLLDNHRIL